MNLYAYVKNNAINSIDPTGLYQKQSEFENLWAGGGAQYYDAGVGGMVNEPGLQSVCPECYVIGGLKIGSTAAKFTVNTIRDISYSQTIQFGKSENQRDHAFRHVENAGFNRKEVESNIRKDLISNKDSPKINSSESRSVTINDTKIDYVAHRLPDGTVNVGRIIPPKK